MRKCIDIQKGTNDVTIKYINLGGMGFTVDSGVLPPRRRIYRLEIDDVVRLKIGIIGVMMDCQIKCNAYAKFRKEF